MAAQFSVVDVLHTNSILQQRRAELVRDSRLKLDVLIRSSLQSAKAVKAKFHDASARYKAALKQVEANLNTIQQKLAETDKSIRDLEKQERDKIIWVIADIITLACATAVVLASLGAFGPVVAALTTSQAIGLGAGATAAVIKLAMNSLSLDDIEKLLGALRGVKGNLEASYKSLKTVKPLLADVVKGADGLELTIRGMVDGLLTVQSDATHGQVLAISGDNVTRIEDSCKEVGEACICGWILSMRRVSCLLSEAHSYIRVAKSIGHSLR
ncbi:hypothetical protein VTI74DRAFT_8017 [Chaetomium olivicolor]